MTFLKRRLIQGVATTFVVASLAAAPPPPLPKPPVFDTTDPAVYGRQLMAYSESLDDGWNDEVSVSSMILFDAGGNSVTRSVSQMTLERSGGDKSVVRFRTPAEIKGVAALTHEHSGGTDDSWLYLPASRRVRRMSGANKTASFQGTEFTFEDLGRIEEADYLWTFLRKEPLDGGEAFLIEGIPKASDSGYSRIIVWVDTVHYRSSRTDYFDKAGEPLKRMDMHDWEHFHGRWWRPTGMEMSNLQSRKRTQMKFSKRFLDLARYPDARTGKPRSGLTDEHFTKRRLEGR